MFRTDCDNREDVVAESKGLDGRSGREASVEYRYDDETDHWLANIDYTRTITIPLLQNLGKIKLPFLCEHHRNQSPTLAAEIHTLLDNYPRPWEDRKLLGYSGVTRRCAYCPTEFIIMIIC